MITKELKEQIARNAASGWCRCFKCDGIVNATGSVFDKDKELTCNQWYHGYRTALMALYDDRLFSNLWKSADGEDLPEVGREVVVFTQNFPDDAGLMKVAIAHRPDPKGFDVKIIATGKVEHYTSKTYGKGGWNIPDVVMWLDLDIPNLEE